MVQDGCMIMETKEVCNPQTDDAGIDVMKVVEGLISVDNQEAFVSFVRCQVEKDKLGILHTELGLRELLMQICFHSAVNCATALLEGEAGMDVDFNSASLYGLYPLHRAARNLCADLVELFLEHAAQTYTCCNDSASIFYGMSPLTVALDAVLHHQYLSDWTPSKSIIKLIYILCMPELSEPLRSIQLLVSHSRDDEFEVISSRIAREGRLVELAILMVVAWKKLMTPVTVSGVEVCMIEQCISDELQLIYDEEVKFMHSINKRLRLCKHKKSIMLSALRMIEIFKRAGEGIEKYRLSYGVQTVGRYMLTTDVAYLLKEHGFSLTKKDVNLDDMRCFQVKLGIQESVELARALSMPLSQELRLSKPAQRVVSQCFGNKSLAAYSPIRSFHACGFLENRSILKRGGKTRVNRIVEGSEQPFHACQISQNAFRLELVNAETRANRTALCSEQSLWKFVSARVWASLALIIKKRIRGI